MSGTLNECLYQSTVNVAKFVKCCRKLCQAVSGCLKQSHVDTKFLNYLGWGMRLKRYGIFSTIGLPV